MAKYKILVIQHLLKNNKIAKSNDIVDGALFINLQDSLNGKYVEEVVEVAVDEVNEELEAELKKIKSLKKDELIAYAKESELEVDEDASAKDIKKLIIEAVTNFYTEEN
jgi:hypothetical protein|tara:strand:- start:440 stop:766 length:327 start_codon:yes stop_codon:yes gene_type:complete